MNIEDNIIYNSFDTIPLDQLQTVVKTIPRPSEINVYKTQNQIISENIYASKMSSRNAVGHYIIPLEADNVLINYIPSKLSVSDSSIYYLMDNTFEYFPEPLFSDILPEPISFAEGTIFRVTGEGVRSKEDYTYYSIENGIVSNIPNYKTVEVLLFERGRSLDDIQIIEPTEFDDLLHNSIINKFVQQGFTPEEATEEAAKLILTSQSQNTMTQNDLG